MIRSAALALAILAFTTPAFAAPRRVTIVNDTGKMIVRLHAVVDGQPGGRSNRSGNAEDKLGDTVLAPGKSVLIDFDDGSDACVFDLGATFDDGTTAMRRSVDVCAVRTYRYTAR